MVIGCSVHDISKSDTMHVTPQAQKSYDIAQEKYTSKDFAVALEHINTTIEDYPRWGKAYELKAFILLGSLDWPGALAASRQALSLDSDLVKPHFFEAANFLLYGQYLSAVKIMRKVKFLHPNYNFNNDENLGLLTSYWRELLANYEAKLPLSGDMLATEALEYFPTQNFLLTIKGHFSLEKGQDLVGAEFLEKALEKNPYSLRTVQMYRKYLLQKQQYKQAYVIWERIVPTSLVFHADNKVQDRYQRVKEASHNADKNDHASLLELARALAGAGWEIEASIVYEQIPGFEEEKQRLYNHLKFVEALREYVIKYYQTARRDIVSMLRDMRRIAKTFDIHLATIPSKEFDRYFWVVREANPLHPKAQTLGEYFLQYNKFFDMGNNYGQIEIRLANRLSDRKYHREIWGKPRTYHTITCDETYIDSYSGYFSGSPTIAGRAFLSNNGFYVAVDTLRPHIVKLKELLKRIESPQNFSSKVSLENKDYLPYSQAIADRFLQLALQEEVAALPKNDDKWDIFFHLILERRLDTVHNHELGHINDLPCFMPIEKNLGTHMRLLWKQKFSPDNIQTRFEHVAELFGIYHTKYLYFYLYQVMERLDADFDGIFTMVYWAWYGRLPSDDPYYKSASRIYRGMLELSGKKDDWQTLKKLPLSQKEQLRQWIYDLCAEQEITHRCDCAE